MYSYPTIANVAMTTGGTEYSYTIPANTKKILFKERSGGNSVKFCFTASASATTYVTLPAGSTKYLEGAWLTGLTLYFQSANSGLVLELEIWQ